MCKGNFGEAVPQEGLSREQPDTLHTLTNSLRVATEDWLWPCICCVWEFTSKYLCMCYWCVHRYLYTWTMGVAIGPCNSMKFMWMQMYTSMYILWIYVNLHRYICICIRTYSYKKKISMILELVNNTMKTHAHLFNSPLRFQFSNTIVFFLVFGHYDVVLKFLVQKHPPTLFWQVWYRLTGQCVSLSQQCFD